MCNTIVMWFWHMSSTSSFASNQTYNYNPIYPTNLLIFQSYFLFFGIMMSETSIEQLLVEIIMIACYKISFESY